MDVQSDKSHSSTFDEIKRVESEVEFWLSRDLAKVLECS